VSTTEPEDGVGLYIRGILEQGICNGQLNPFFSIAVISSWSLRLLIVD
jgi:hypothetical protein